MTDRYLKIKPCMGETISGIKSRSKCNGDAGLKRSTNPAARIAPVDIHATVKNYLLTNTTELRYKPLRPESPLCLLFLIDSSASMLRYKQIAVIKGLIQQTAEAYKHKKINYAAVALCSSRSAVITKPTSDKKTLMDSIHKLHSGGRTNMIQALRTVHQLVNTSKKSNSNYRLFIFTDGKINAGETDQPFTDAVSFYNTFLRSLKDTTVVNTEKGFVKLQMASQFATAIQASYIEYHEQTN